MTEKHIEIMRREIDLINMKILRLLNERAEKVKTIGGIKYKKHIDFFNPERESEMLRGIIAENKGPFSDDAVKRIFKEIFKASLSFIDESLIMKLQISRKFRKEDTVVKAGHSSIGGGPFSIIAGPCSVEDYNQLDSIASYLKKNGITFLRAGVYKPRTSPYSFQGLRNEGLKILKEVTLKYKMLSVTEVLDPRDIDKMHDYIDIFQIGARNMYNYELLKEIGKVEKPVLLKRGFMATLEEFLFAAEYISVQGNGNIILCERGIRTFERWTRNTLDISAIPILKKESHLPVIVDISHSTGRRDIAKEVAAASMFAGADGIMAEVHNNPSIALSDNEQQLDFKDFRELSSYLKKLAKVKR